MTADRRRSVWLLLGVWSLFGFIVAVQGYSIRLTMEKPLPFLRILPQELFYAYLWAAATPLVFWLVRKFPLDRCRWMLCLPAHLGAALVIGAVVGYIWTVVVRKVLMALEAYTTSYTVFQGVVSSLEYGLMIYAIIAGAAHAIENRRRYENERLEALRLETKLAQAQLQALKMQLHPHFLFNTLHTISALVHEDPSAAERMIARLSDLLRLSLENAPVQEVPLRQELEFVRRYLEIEQIRFEDRLRVEYDVDPATLEAHVPNLILQPLVENAIRHGLRDRTEGGELSISARREDSSLMLAVADNGCGLPGGSIPEDREGVGLSNTRARLRRLYGDRQSFHLSSPSGGGLTALIEIPWELPDAESVPRN
jgi:two-component system, LytTR family, sensor kinase